MGAAIRDGGNPAGDEVSGVSNVKVYSYSEARQRLAELLNRARREGLSGKSKQTMIES